MLSLANDWQIIDDTQSITYFSKINEGVYASGFTIPNVYWEDIAQLDYMRSPDLLMQQGRHANIWTSQMSGAFLSGVQITPKLDDKIQDQNGLLYYASEVEELDLDANGIQRYRVKALLGT